MAEALKGAGDAVSEPAEAGEAAVAELDVLEVAPEILDRVEVGRVAGEAFELEPGGRPGDEEVLDGLAAVGGQTIPDDEQLARDLGEQVLQEADDGRAIEGLGLGQRVDFARFRQRRDDREVVAGELAAQDRGLAAGGPGPDRRRQEVEACLIYPEDRSFFGAGLFFYGGKMTWREGADRAAVGRGRRREWDASTGDRRRSRKSASSRAFGTA